MGLLMFSSLAFLGGMYVMLAFAWWILQVIANWRIFTKAGEAGWKSIIPIYGDYVSYKIAWKPSYFWLMFGFNLLAYIIGDTYNADGKNLILTLIVMLINLIVIVIGIIYSVKLARAFGRGTGFAIGLIFLQPIFLLILGFGSDSYYGPDR